LEGDEVSDPIIIFYDEDEDEDEDNVEECSQMSDKGKNNTANKAEHTSELRQRVTAAAFKEAYKAFIAQADENASSGKAKGSQTPYGFPEKPKCDGEHFKCQYGQGTPSAAPYMNWSVVSIYYLPNSEDIIMGIEEDRYSHFKEMSIKPLRYAQIGNKKVRTLVFYSTNKSRVDVDYGELYEKFISVCEEVIQIKQEEPEKLEELMEIKFNNSFSYMLYDSKNLILHGAPGTGKSYLAKEIAADIITNGQLKYNDLLKKDEQKDQVAFVQFHPNYDYSDFVEGLRPRINEDGTMGFELKDGVFKSFIERAKKNYEDYELTRTELKRYVFIIDEINRGEISKILGELFYCIDPGYRGRDGEIFTQYANLHSDPNEKFYIPENVYIIGTMNDIDRSVDSFDFAMRRRFRFVELKASEQLDMLNSLKDELRDEAKSRMTALNEAIVNIKELNSNYQIGAAYFLKLNNLSSDKCFDELWTDYLEPLLQEYVRGMYKESDIMKQLEKAYKLETSIEGETDESGQN